MKKIIGVNTTSVSKIVGKSYSNLKKIFTKDLPPKLFEIGISASTAKDGKLACELKTDQSGYFPNSNPKQGDNVYTDSTGNTPLANGWWNTTAAVSIYIQNGVIQTVNVC